MSNSASIAAAKKRRSQPQYSTQQQTNQKVATNSATNSATNNNLQNTTQINRPVTQIELLKQHDYKLYCLEKKIDSVNEDLVTKRDLELLSLDNSVTNKTDNIATNKIENNCKDITTLKTTVSKLTKSVSDTNALTQSMRATLLSQTNELNELKQFKIDFYKFIEEQTEEVVEEETENKEETEEVQLVINEVNEVNESTEASEAN